MAKWEGIRAGHYYLYQSENGTKLYIDLIKAYLAEKRQALLDIELKQISSES